MKKLILFSCIILNSANIFGNWSWVRNWTNEDLDVTLHFLSCSDTNRLIERCSQQDLGEGGCCPNGITVKGNFNNSPYHATWGRKCQGTTTILLYKTKNNNLYHIDCQNEACEPRTKPNHDGACY